MTRNKKYWLLIIGLLIIIPKLKAQVDAFASLRINRNEVYPEQPIKATINVYTATWFTQPLDFDNFQVSNAFIIPFKRTLSTMKEIRGKKYATLEYYYLIYPYESGSYQVPTISIRIETPPIGDYKGQPVTVTTKSVDFTVKKEPTDFADKTWFVAKNVIITQSWDKPLSSLKIGDVIERTISIRASGTLPNFIPVLTFPDPEFGSAYHKVPKLVDRRNEKDVNGTRIEKVVYLLEKVGEFEVPTIRVDWWNPYSQKVLFRELEPVTLNIADNPNLGMMKTLKDSLSLASVEIGGEDTVIEPLTILGLPIWKFLASAAALLFVLNQLWISVLASYKKVLAKKKAYLASEEYLFKTMLHSNRTEPKAVLNEVHIWWDRFRSEQVLPASFRQALEDFGNAELDAQWTQLESGFFRDSTSTSVSPTFFNLLKGFRESILAQYDYESRMLSGTQLSWE